MCVLGGWLAAVLREALEVEWEDGTSDIFRKHKEGSGISSTVGVAPAQTHGPPEPQQCSRLPHHPPHLAPGQAQRLVPRQLGQRQAHYHCGDVPSRVPLAEHMPCVLQAPPEPHAGPGWERELSALCAGPWLGCHSCCCEFRSSLSTPGLSFLNTHQHLMESCKTSSQKGPGGGLMSACCRVALLQLGWEKQKQGPGCEH